MSPLEIKDISRSGEFSGYASLFDRMDLGKDKIARGAFRKSIKERGLSGIRMLFQHDASEPIGTWSDIHEDQKGLFVRGKIVRTTQRGADVLSLMRSGAIDGLSIGFKTRSAVRDKVSGVRTIREADLWEVSIVTFPMLPQARISEVKGQPALPTIRQFEHWLTRDAGLTRGQARCVISKGFAHLMCKRDAAEPTDELVAKMRRAADQFTHTDTRRNPHGTEINHARP